MPKTFTVLALTLLACTAYAQAVFKCSATASSLRDALDRARTECRALGGCK